MLMSSLGTKSNRSEPDCVSLSVVNKRAKSADISIEAAHAT